MSDGEPLLSLTTGLGTALSAVAFHAIEAISTPYVVEVEAISDRTDIDPASILYKPACLTVTRGGGTRYFHGLVRAFAASGVPRRGYHSYQISIVPRLWFMGQTVDCRIFQQKTVGDILQALCQEAGQTIDLRIFTPQTTQDYVTQFNESDLQFASRLMEQAGLFYCFKHASGDHVLVVTDRNQGLPPGDKPVLAVIHEGDNLDTLSDWHRRPATAWGSVTLRDYDPSNPGTTLSATTSSSLDHAGTGKRDVMQWPALSLQGQTVTDRSRYMVQAAEAQAALIDAAGSNHLILPGARFTLERDPASGAAGEDYIVHSVRHQGSDDIWITGGGTASYDNSLTVFPVAVPWRQPFATPRPVMAGIYAALVIGNDGEEIHADNLGRIKVRLLWDHRSETVAEKGVWARVVQPWAGNQWGWQHLPRVGTEVAVAFIDGDADRPVVMGGLYNGDMSPPFAVPAEQTKSGFRSRSSSSGGTANFSEFSIDDKMGSELVYLHAEKDLTTEVENNQTLSVTNNRTVTVTQQESITVGAGRTTTIQQGGDALTVQSGDLTIQVSAGAVSIQAMSKIELTVGSNSVKIDPSGITLNGMLVNVQGQSLVQIKAAMTQVNADGMMVLQGGIVTVN